MRKESIVLFLIVLVLAVAGTTAYVAFTRKPANTPTDNVPVAQDLNDSVAVAKPNPDFAGASSYVEAEQLILPDGHPTFPADTTWVVIQGDTRPIELPIPLTIPANWQGLYTVRAEGNSAYYDFIADAAVPQAIFSITALTESGWQAIQGEPHGEALLFYGGIVWVYNPSLENPYSGPQADAFSQMVGEAYDISRSLATYFTPVVTVENSLPILKAYLEALAGSQYGEAALLYGGNYDQLTAFNPEIAPDDPAALFAAACTTNGFICDLTIHEVLQAEQLSELTIQFTVTLAQLDSTVFELGPCCGEAVATAVQREFVFTVTHQDGRFLVVELPVYAA